VCVLLEACRPCPRWWGLRPLLGADVPAGLVHVSDLKQPGYYVTGRLGPGVEVPGRVAAWLESKLDLRRVRTDARGVDPEVDAVLADLHRVALVWRASVDASDRAEPSQADALLPWLTVSEAADQLGVTGSRERQLVHTNALPAERVDRRWRINRLDFQHFKAARAA
jgi:excisionase family DNA binding protein